MLKVFTDLDGNLCHYVPAFKNETSCGNKSYISAVNSIKTLVGAYWGYKASRENCKSFWDALVLIVKNLSKPITDAEKNLYKEFLDFIKIVGSNIAYMGIREKYLPQNRQEEYNRIKSGILNSQEDPEILNYFLELIMFIGNNPNDSPSEKKDFLRDWWGMKEEDILPYAKEKQQQMRNEERMKIIGGFKLVF